MIKLFSNWLVPLYHWKKETRNRQIAYLIPIEVLIFKLNSFYFFKSNRKGATSQVEATRNRTDSAHVPSLSTGTEVKEARIERLRRRRRGRKCSKILNQYKSQTNMLIPKGHYPVARLPVERCISCPNVCFVSRGNGGGRRRRKRRRWCLFTSGSSRNRRLQRTPSEYENMLMA